MFGRALFALPVTGALLAGLAGCGGGSGAQPDRQAGQVSQGVAVGEPAPVALALADFQARARAAACTETRNRLFVIDGTKVLWDHAGNCADASYEQVLYGAKPDTVLCSHGDTIAGPRTTCPDAASRSLFDTIVQNLDKADLGLGSTHKVERISFLPAAGTQIAFERIAKDSFSGVTAKKNLVIKEEAAWARLWAEHTTGRNPAPELPKVDFANKMLVAVFAGESGSGCHTIAIPRVVAGAASIRVEIDERELQTFDVCPAVVTHAMQVVAIDRNDVPGDAAVEFVAVSGTDLPFKTISQTSNSKVEEARNVVVKDAAAWERLWAYHAPNEPVPVIDFSTKMVVGVFMGPTTPCYSTWIAGVRRGADKITVQKIDRHPPIGVMCALMVTKPGHLVEIERSDLPVEFATEIVQEN
jgi:hypothetical protein